MTRTLPTHAAALIACCALAWPAPAFALAQEEAGTLDFEDLTMMMAEPAEETVTRVYPVGSLLASVTVDAEPAQAYGGGGGLGGGGGGGGFGGGGGRRVQPSEQAQNALVAAVTAVAADSWHVNGGVVGSIRFFGDKMIVTHTPQVHGQVAELLSAMQGRQVVTVRAMLVQLDAAQVPQMTESKGGLTLVKADDLSGLPTVAQVRISGFEGRSHTAADGRSVSYVAQAQPVVASGAVGYQMVYGTVETGLTLEVTPTLEPEGGAVLLDVDARYVLSDGPGQAAPAATPETRREPSPPATRPAIPPLTPAGDPYGTYSGYGYGQAPASRGRSAPPEVGLTVDRQAIKTSLRAPTGRWVLVGSLGASDDGQPTDEPPVHLLLRVDAE